MSARCPKNKSKKPLETSLGQAPKDLVDESHLRKPISTSIRGLKQVFALFENATNEVKDYISFECDILYECRLCRNIFRSLANFILHKRNFCREKFHTGGVHPEGDCGGFIVDHNEGGDGGKRGTIADVIGKLKKRQEVECLSENCLNEDLSEVRQQEGGDDDVVVIADETKECSVVLEHIPSSQHAMYQTQGRNASIKAEVLEIHALLHTNAAALDAHGKVSSFETKKRLPCPDSPPRNLVCKECNFTFSTVKTLTHHIKYKHNKTCLVYPCPDCKQTFSNVWSVYRHLFKVHRRTNAQVKRMRAQIHSGRLRKDQEPPAKKKPKSDIETKEDRENEWMTNFEGDKDLQMCGGCGRRFERKAALQSHSQMCTKRLAVCNNIKKGKKVVAEKGEKIEANCAKVLKGANRRKPVFAQRYQGGNSPEPPEIEIFTISDDSSSKEGTNEPEDEFREYVNDEVDGIFLSKAGPYMVKDELKCLPCADSFLSPNQLLWHMSLHFSWFRFQCSKCPFSSFNKYDCTTHALTSHSTPANLMESTVLPIPKWKVLCASHDFVQLNVEIAPPDVTAPLPETIVLDDDDITDENTQQPEKKDKPGPSKTLNERPVRNRMKSVKTFQSDFIYDLGKVLKLNDSSIKGTRLKKSLK